MGLALICAACGGDDSGSGGEGATSATVDQNVKNAVADALGGSTTAPVATSAAPAK
jgi:hypothetical protein